MSPIPNNQKVIGVKQTADADRHMGNSPRQHRTEDAANQGADTGDECALPEKNRGDVDPAVAHRAQDRDFSDFRKD